MLESSRKHGAFDGRFPAVPKLAAPTWETRHGENDQEQLDWSAFLARFFPHRRRHDHEAVAAYEAYRSRLSQRSLDQTSGMWQSRLDRRRSRFFPDGDAPYAAASSSRSGRVSGEALAEALVE
jgi:Bacterial protein of unknown function (DUF922)